VSDLLVRQKFSLPVSPEAVAEDWRARGYSFGRFIDPPGQEWNNFVHDVNELVMVEMGRLEMSVGDQSFIVEEGDEVYIPKGAVHSLKNIHDGVSRWLYGYD
jgi:quercetin dioxygenase-like cupin family protein